MHFTHHTAVNTNTHTRSSGRGDWRRFGVLGALLRGISAVDAERGDKARLPSHPRPHLSRRFQRPFGTEICPCWPGVDTVSPSGVDKEKKIRAKRE